MTKEGEVGVQWGNKNFGISIFSEKAASMAFSNNSCQIDLSHFCRLQACFGKLWPNFQNVPIFMIVAKPLTGQIVPLLLKFIKLIWKCKVAAKFGSISWIFLQSKKIRYCVCLISEFHSKFSFRGKAS